MAKKKLYHIETLDGCASLNFLTTATDSKKALKNLIENSFDFKNCCKKDSEIITITIKRVK